MSVVHKWLNYLLVVGSGKFNPLINVNSWAVALAILSVFLILLPRGLGNKYIGAGGLILAFFIPLKQLPDLQMLVFDVGQGTAIFVRTPHYQMVYDTGPIYTENFDAGSGIIVPYLQSQGIEHLDKLIVSHNDQDHSGGLTGVLAGTKVNQLWMGEPEKFHKSDRDPIVENCHEQQPWSWDKVNFRFITWPAQPQAKANNHSCVLLIEFNGQKILLTGDIEKDVERTLLAQESLTHMDILLAPHHGSHTSSTPEFVAQVHPKNVIYSAGYHNQHGHPHVDVQQRYKSAGSIPLNTAFNGALEFIWQDDLTHVRQYRQVMRRWWFDIDEEPEPAY
ncbi:MAG: DNA internalization-related competence protein ComEC/Rec2 [Moraxellaceae bacterium]|nr:MAG: DNA internalization-related competence protein ComEC/Rec2 [Moraxellaceae bacterium]